MCVCVCGWREGPEGGGHSILTSNYVRFFLIHSILPTDLFCFPSPAHGPNPNTKGEDYRKSGKTKLITRGISTSQCCLKCNYMGLELWLRLGWLQISHWQTCPWCKNWLPLKMTAGERPGLDEEISIMSLSTTWKKTVEKKLNWTWSTKLYPHNR